MVFFLSQPSLFFLLDRVAENNVLALYVFFVIYMESFQMQPLKSNVMFFLFFI